MTAHITKEDHKDGEKLKLPLFWCGKESSGMEWHFVDTHHAALAVGGSVQPCKSCIRAIIREFNKELE